MGDVRIEQPRTVDFLRSIVVYRTALLRFMLTCCGATVLTTLDVRAC